MTNNLDRTVGGTLQLLDKQQLLFPGASDEEETVHSVREETEDFPEEVAPELCLREGEGLKRK